MFLQSLQRAHKLSHCPRSEYGGLRAQSNPHESLAASRTEHCVFENELIDSVIQVAKCCLKVLRRDTLGNSA